MFSSTGSTEISTRTQRNGANSPLGMLYSLSSPCERHGDDGIKQAVTGSFNEHRSIRRNWNEMRDRGSYTNPNEKETRVKRETLVFVVIILLLRSTTVAQWNSNFQIYEDWQLANGNKTREGEAYYTNRECPFLNATLFSRERSGKLSDRIFFHTCSPFLYLS